MNDFQKGLVATFEECFAAWVPDVLFYEPDTADERAIIVTLKFSVKRFGETEKGEIFMETL